MDKLKELFLGDNWASAAFQFGLMVLATAGLMTYHFGWRAGIFAVVGLAGMGLIGVLFFAVLDKLQNQKSG